MARDATSLSVFRSPRRLFEDIPCVGYGVRMLPLRIRLTTEQTFADFCKSVYTSLLEAMDHSRLRLHDLVRDAEIVRPKQAPPSSRRCSTIAAIFWRFFRRDARPADGKQAGACIS